MITATDLSRTYPDGTVALASTNIAIPKGQFVALIGPSGCGKSTLINLLAGLDQPTAGTAHIAGRSAMVFQEPALFPWLNIRDNIEFGGKLRGVPVSKRREQSDALLKMVHLRRFADAFPHQLSGGMRQRAAIARALMLEPDVLLMDEPFGALDAQTRSLLQQELLSIWQATGKTIVFVTHSLDEALLLADRIIFMSARPGRVVGDVLIDAPYPRDVYGHPFLTSLHTRLQDLLEKEVAAVAAAEHDDGWMPPLSVDTAIGPGEGI